jgi:hypothetical protein
VIQREVYQRAAKKQAHFRTPPVALQSSKQAPLLSWSGIVVARNLMKRLGVAEAIDGELSLLQRHRPYAESDHVLSMVYNFLTGGETLLDLERLQGERSFLQVIGAEQFPDPTAAGDFLVRFTDADIGVFQKVMEEVQGRAFELLEEGKKRRGTIDSDSSLYEVYGEKKEGADFSYTNCWSYSGLHLTLSETGDVLYQELREGNRHSSEGVKEVLPGIIERVKKHFREVWFRGDSAFYTKDIVEICDERVVKFFIVADQTKRLMGEVQKLGEGAWKSFGDKKKRGNGGKRKKRRNERELVALKRKPSLKYKGRAEVASLWYQPTGWKKGYRFVMKRTELVEKGNQLSLSEGMKSYAYHIIVTNSRRSEAAVMRIAQRRANQENLIKDFKGGLGLSHVPTGRFNANKIYFKIAALAWNIKTWMLNLLELGDGAAMRFKRFLYRWIYWAGVVSKTGRNAVVVRMADSGYLHRLQRALSRVESLKLPIV